MVQKAPFRGKRESQILACHPSNPVPYVPGFLHRQQALPPTKTAQRASHRDTRCANALYLN